MIACYGQDHEVCSTRRRMVLIVSSDMKEEDE